MIFSLSRSNSERNIIDFVNFTTTNEKNKEFPGATWRHRELGNRKSERTEDF